ncbi:UNVERIFIED_CONTAM: hypothetical protein PYX00_004293 [Menopon gallinae]|uniref:PX domain-containing protein n=1 Tax=Menopon gallinae TaxID=328185 RepID=A0AAW2I361_9NEOP
MAESLECDTSEKLDTDKSTTLPNDRTLDLENDSDISLSLEGSVVASPSIESFSTLPEAESSLNLCEDTPDLAVRVDNPQKHFDLFETYITFRVTTKTTRAEFETTDYCVRRRYNDFSWLRQHLVEEYPTHFIPPLPVKHSIIGQLDRYGRDFVTARMAALQTFLTRVVKHPILSSAACFKCFLTASNEEFQQVRKLTTSNVIAKKFSDSLSTLATLHIEPQRPPEMTKLNEYLAVLSDKLSHICKISQRIHKERTEKLSELLELKAIFQQWAGSESDLTDPLCEVASAVDKVKQSLQNVVLDTENFILTQPLKEYLLYTEAVKEALVRRDNIEINYRLLAEALEKKKQEKEELLAGGKRVQFTYVVDKDCNRNQR